MKVNLEFDLSPEEARRLLGLPDVSKANEIYVETVTKAMKGVASVDQLQQYAMQLAPMGQAGLKMFQSLFETAAKSAIKPGKGD